MSSTAVVPSGASAVVRTAQAAPAAARNASLTPVKQAISSSLQSTAQSNAPQLYQQRSQQAPQQSPQRTPAQQRASPAVSTPGKWQHPRMEEVIRRQNATNFDKNNVFHITWCICALLLTIIVPHFANQAVPSSLIQPLEPYPHYVLLIIRASITISLAYAVSPLFRPKDACEDIPLTPSQRHMLGLPPSSRPQTALDQSTGIITPPRYSRSSTPRSGNSLRGSPLSGSPMDFGSSQQRPSSGSLYSPSPLATKSYESGFANHRDSVGFGVTRRLSYGGGSNSPRGSPLNLSEFETAGNVGSPSRGNKASVGLNSKWLYEKGRRSPSGSGSGGFGASRGPTMFT